MLALVVTHRGAINVTLSRIFGLSPDRMPRLVIGNISLAPSHRSIRRSSARSVTQPTSGCARDVR